jgi:hypothetical protein
MPAATLIRKLFPLLLVVLAASVSAQEFQLKSDGNMKWYRGNMHTHSLWSDGDDYPEMIARWYREHGYQFLVFTDHNTLLQRERWISVNDNKGGRKAFDALQAAFPGDWVVTRTTDKGDEVRLKTFDKIFQKLAAPQEYLLIQGEEISDKFGKLPIHLCAANTNELLPPTGGESVVDVMQRNIDAAISRRERTGIRTLVHLNHPNFGYAITAEDLMRVVGENFFEVYNGHPSVYNSGDSVHASTERMWDIINTWRLSKLGLPLMYGLATDDGHSYFEKTPGKEAQPGRGWVHVLAGTLTPDALIESLESGRFYSSSGVRLKEVRFTEKTLMIEVDADEGVDYRIDFIGTNKGFDDGSTPTTIEPTLTDQVTRRYSRDVGTVFKSENGPSASYKMEGSEIYVRAVVTASRPHPNPSEAGEFERAWIQPISGLAASRRGP